MAKTKYQQAAMKYAKEYLDKLLDLEDYMGHKLDSHINSLVDKRIEQRLRNAELRNNLTEKKENEEKPSPQ